jgi:hypothetical protein
MDCYNKAFGLSLEWEAMYAVLGRLNLNFHRAFGVHTRIGLLGVLRLYRVRSVLNRHLERSLVEFAFCWHIGNGQDFIFSAPDWANFLWYKYNAWSYNFQEGAEGGKQEC